MKAAVGCGGKMCFAFFFTTFSFEQEERKQRAAVGNQARAFWCFPKLREQRRRLHAMLRAVKKKKKRNIKLRERKNASIYHFANFIGQKKKTWKYSRRSGPLFFFSLLKTAKKSRFSRRKTQKAHTKKKKTSLHRFSPPHHASASAFFFSCFCKR